jgi:hypothetical protein
MGLHFKLQLVVIADDDEQVSVDDLVVLTKEHQRLEQLGLMLAEAKALLLELQHQVVSHQMAAFNGCASALSDLRSSAWRQGPQGHHLPDLVREAEAGESAAASVSVPGLRPGIPEPIGRVTARAHCTRAAVSGKQVGVSGFLWADCPSLA